VSPIPRDVEPGPLAGNAGRCFALTVITLVVFNVARGFGLLGPSLLSAAVLCLAMILIAWKCHATLADLGLRRQNLRAGLAYGLGALAVVLVVLLVTAVIPATNGFLHDSRAAISAGRMAYELAVLILVGTVVPEELAFRGVLLGSALQLWGRWRAVLITSVLFGLWHVAPTLRTRNDNQSVRHASTVLVVLAAVTITFIAGVTFCWLRLRSGSLVAPALAHFATNGLGLAVAWFAVH
jgi:membrane protease YdiL (CAAX protease family)